MQIEHDGVSLHVADDGNPTGPVVLFLHGITSCTDTWDWALADLVADHRVLRASRWPVGRACSSATRSVVARRQPSRSSDPISCAPFCWKTRPS